MFSPEAENLIAHLARQLAPADRNAFRRAAESALDTPQCWGPGLIHRTVVAVWRNYFYPRRTTISRPGSGPSVEHVRPTSGWWGERMRKNRRKPRHKP
jgi:hypothetical protein